MTINMLEFPSLTADQSRSAAEIQDALERAERVGLIFDTVIARERPVTSDQDAATRPVKFLLVRSYKGQGHYEYVLRGGVERE